MTFVIDHNVNRIYTVILSVSPYLLIFSIPRLIRTEKEYARLFSVFFSFVFVQLFIQLFEVISAKTLASFLGETMFRYSGNDMSSQEFFFATNRIIVYSVEILLISFITAFYYLSSPMNPFNKNYLYSVVSVITLSIIMSGTRGWMISLLFMFIAFIITNRKGFSKSIKPIFTIVVIIIIFVIFSPTTKKYLEKGIERLDTITKLAAGDITAGGTLGRLTVRGPRVWEKFIESPIVGFGFTDVNSEYRDVHVGHHTMLLNGGIVGYMIFMLLFISFNYKLFRAFIRGTHLNTYKFSLSMLIIGFGGIFIIHSTSRQEFGYIVNIETMFMLSLYFVFSDFTYKLLKKNN
ncbi:MAG: hypothetical protein L3J08_00275 [Flavobacteriaceae bacterium]|nr:hypothetical protein [Flavobacteriaceae bacterium]